MRYPSADFEDELDSTTPRGGGSSYRLKERNGRA
jgi:hypothetical protein